MKRIYGRYTNKKEKGITTIELVITIIVLLILAGIVLYFMTKSNIIDKAFDSKEETIRAKEKELISLAYLDCQMNYRTNQEPIDVENFQIAMKKQDEKTNTTEVSDEEGNEGEIVADIENHTGFARVTFEETKHDYYIGLLEGNAFQIKYDSVGGIDGPKEQLKREGQTLIITDKVPTKLDYDYVEWNTSKDGSGDKYVAGDSYTEDKSITLYAIWKPTDNPTTYTITYNLNGGNISKENPTSYNIFTGDIKLNNPTKSGYTFTGWMGTDLNEITKTVIIKGGSRGNREYTANWAIPIYAVDGNESYVTLEEALEACNDGSTITLLRDVTDKSTTIVNTKNITINLNGHTMETQATINNNGTIHIIDKDNNGNSLGGKIVNNNDTCIMNKGILQLGENDQVINNSINIEGVTGIQNEGTFKYYDGQIVGNKAIRGNIDETADDYKAVSMRANDKEIVNLKQLAEYQARIVGIYYPTLSKAIEAVQKDEIVTLLVGLSLDSSLEIKDKDRFILDLNGNTITTNIQDYVLKNYSDLEIIDSSNEKTGTIDGSNYSVIYNNPNSKLKISSGTINLISSGTEKDYKYAIVNDNGNLEINGGTICSISDYTYTVYNVGGTVITTGGTLTNSGKASQVICNEDKIQTEKVGVMDNINLVKNGDYYFENKDGKLISNNNKKSNSTAYSYLELDLSDFDEDVLFKVNAQISSENGHDYGFVTINESTTAPLYSNSKGQLLKISGTVEAKDYFIQLSKGKKYYIHFGYRKDGGVNQGEDCFQVNSLGISKIKDASIYSNVNIYGTTINVNGISVSSSRGDIYSCGIFNSSNGEVKIGSSKVVLSNSNGYKLYGIYNKSNGTIDVKENCEISSVSSRTDYYGICNDNNGIINISKGIINLISETSTYGIYNGKAGNINIDSENIKVENVDFNRGGECYGILNNEGKIITENCSIRSKVNRGNAYGVKNSNGEIDLKNIIMNIETAGPWSYSYSIYNSENGIIKVDKSTTTNTTSPYMNYDCITYGAYNVGGGTIELNSTNIEMTKKDVAKTYGLYNKETGKINMINTYDDTVRIVASEAGITNVKGEINLGTKDNNISNNIEIIGDLYGIKNQAIFNFYDGKLNGKIAINGNINEVENNTEIQINIENDIENACLIYQSLNLAENVETGEKFETLEKAIESCTENQAYTIKILRDAFIIGQNIINENQNIKLDLNGNRIYSLRVENNGKFEITDSSEEKTGSIINNDTIINNGTLVIINGTISCNVDVAINNNGDVTIKEGTVENNNGNAINNKGGIVNILGGTIISTASGIYNDAGNIEFTGGTITFPKVSGTLYGIYNLNSGKIHIDGGTISAIGLSLYSSWSTVYGIYNVDDGEVILNTGTIVALTSHSGVGSYSISAYGIYNVSTGSIVIGEKGNTLNTENPSIEGYNYGIYNPKGTIYLYDGVIKGINNYVSNGLTGIEEDTEVNEFSEDNYKCVNLKVAEVVAKVKNINLSEEEEFKQIEKAIDRCNELEGETLVTIVKNCTFYNTLNIQEDKNIRIDLNNNMITCSSTQQNIQIINNGKLKILNGTIKDNSSGVNSSNCDVVIENNSNLELNAVILINDGKYIKLIENNENSNVIVKGGEISFSLGSTSGSSFYGYGIYNVGNGNVDIYDDLIINSRGGQSTYSYGIYNADVGTVNMNGGTINAGVGSTSGGTYGIYNEKTGKININLGNIIVKPTGKNGYGIYNKNGEIEINEGNISVSTGYGIYIETGNVFMHGGNISLDKTSYGIYNREGNITMNGGSITLASNQEQMSIGIYNENTGIVTIGEKDKNVKNDFPEINGNAFGIYNPSGIVYYYDGIIRGKNNYISSGFSGIEEDSDLNEYQEIINEETYKCVNLKQIMEIAKIENENLEEPEEFKVLDEAIARCMELEGKSIVTLLNNCNIYNSLVINEGKEIIIDLNSYTVNSSIQSPEIINSGKLTIKNGNLNSHLSGKYNNIRSIIRNIGELIIDENCKIETNGTYVYVIENNDKAKLTMNRGRINIITPYSISFSTGTSYPSYGIFNNSTESIEINNGDIDSETKGSYGIYNNLTGTIDINGGNINTYSIGIYNKGKGIININNGKVESTNASGIYNAGLGNIIIQNGSIMAKEYGVYNYGLGGITIGCKSEVVKKDTPSVAGEIYGISNSSGTLKFYDGIVKGKTTSIYGTVSEVESNHIIKISTEDDYYCSTLIPQSKEDAVIYGNGTYYQTVQDAINACSDSTKTYLLTMVNGSTEDSITIGENQDIIIDLNGYSIISNSENPIFINNGKLQITDTGYDESTSKFGQIVNKKGSAIQNNGSNLTIGEITENDNIYTQAPIIQGETYGIENANSEAIISVYDGVIKGKTSALLNATINNIPEGYKIIKSTLDGIEIVTIEVIE